MCVADQKNEIETKGVKAATGNLLYRTELNFYFAISLIWITEKMFSITHTHTERERERERERGNDSNHMLQILCVYMRVYLNRKVLKYLYYKFIIKCASGNRCSNYKFYAKRKRFIKVS